MKQQCDMSFVWLTWVGLPVLAAVMGKSFGWPAGVLVLAAGVVSQWAYIRWFPRISRWIGYGRVSDRPAGDVSEAEGIPEVTLYTANVCPFCPIVKRRIQDLKGELQFELEEVDVTFRPHLVREKGIRSVPAVEVNGRFLVGNATSAELAKFLIEAGNAFEGTA